MATFDNLDAPQFSTFEDNDLEEVETYFEVDHETNYAIMTMEKKKPEMAEPSIEEKYYSPMPNIPSPQSSIPTSSAYVLKLRNRKIRRSMSSGHLPIPITNLQEALEDTHLNEEASTEQKVEKFEYGKLKKAKSSSQSKMKWCSQENLNRLAAPKNAHASNGNLTQSSSPYVSVAEAVKKFQEMTPTRFHSRNKNQTNIPSVIPLRLKATIPHSPRLLTKRRVKYTATVLSHEEQERLEFEEAQKFKIKANPVNKKIFQQPLKAVHVDKKPATVPEPFKLTKVEHKKTEPSPKKDSYHFHARPVPKCVLEPKKVIEKQTPAVTAPITPSFLKRIPKASPVKKQVEKSVSLPLKNTKPEPFSFEKRDLKVLQKKEEMIKKVAEEEKKAREFHARPIPKPVASMINTQKQKMINGSSSSSSQSELRRSNENIQEEHFKARPPTVLYQKPFEPKKPEHALIEIQPFQLHSEVRAKEREMFERKKKEQLEKANEELKKMEIAKMKQEEEEIKNLRKGIIFKAHPLRNYKELIIKPSGKVTEPISPVFRSGKSNKENVQQMTQL